MSATTQLAAAVLAALGWVAVGTDLLYRRIPNGLVLAGVALGLLFQVVAPSGDGLFGGSGGLGLERALLGGIAGLAIFLPMVMLGAMGAGDAKLLAMAGVWLGARHVAYAALWTLLAGGVLALGAAVYGRVLRQVLANIAHGLLPAMAHRMSARDGTGAAGFVPTGRLPYAVAIAAGTAIEVLRVLSPGR